MKNCHKAEINCKNSLKKKIHNQEFCQLCLAIKSSIISSRTKIIKEYIVIYRKYLITSANTKDISYVDCFLKSNRILEIAHELRSTQAFNDNVTNNFEITEYRI